MKKILSLLLVLALSCTCAFAQTEGTVVYVTVCDAVGGVYVANTPVELSDADEDGSLTINDALIIAHDEHCKGGYATSVTEFGPGITMLWGKENGSGFGYYLNDVSAFSLLDPVANGDYVCAYIFTDTASFSDTYSYFDIKTAVLEQAGTVELTLSAAGYDESWNPVTLPVEGAVITIDGERTDIVTDAQGKASVEVADGAHVISAVSDSMTLVPPVCTVQVGEAEASKGIDDRAIVNAVIAAAAACAVIALFVVIVKKKK